MNISPYTLAFFIPFLINVLAGFLVISNNHRHRTNIVFSFVPLIFAIWSFSYIVIFNAASSWVTLFWAKIIWTAVSFLAPVYMHLALIYPKQRKLSEYKLTYILLYAPAVALAFITWLTPWMVKGPQSTAYAKYFYSYGPATIAFSIYLEIVVVIVTFMLLSTWKNSPRKREKLQSKWVFLATFVPIVGGSISNLILPIMGYYVFPMAPIFTAVMSSMVAYAILKYRIISVTPASSAEVIVSMLPGIFILLDTEQKILHTNRRLQELLGYEKNELMGQSIKLILAKDEQAQGLPWKRWEEKNYYQNFNIHFASRAGNKVLISFSGTIIEDENSDIVGLVGIGFPVNA